MKKAFALILFLIIHISGSIFAQKVGLVLSGGGAKGMTHIGIIRALEENNIPIDYITGTSENGIIELKPGQYACIYNIISGTDFEVTEVDYDTQKYYLPSYEVTTGTADDISIEENASGTIKLYQNAKVIITNRLLSVQDTPYIEIIKTFTGLNPEEKDDFKQNFKIVLYSDEQCTKPVKELNLASATKIPNGDSYQYKWCIDGLEAGTYYLKEFNYAFDETTYKVTTVVNGKELSNYTQGIRVDTKAPELKIVDGFERVTPCDQVEFDFADSDNLIVAKLTNGKYYFVWSKDPLSAGARSAVKKLIYEKINSFSTISTGNVVFYSGWENLTNGITVQSGKISVSDRNSDGFRKLVFEGTNVWSQVAYGQYSVISAIDAEISITNHYEENGVDVDLEKYGTGWKQEIAGAEFELVSGVKSNGKIVWNEGSAEKVIVDDTQEFKIDLPKLKSGYYRLKETKAPIGYSLLNDTIYFVVDAGEQTVALTDANGNILQNQTEEFYKIESGKPATIQIMNKALYDLPSAGGSGIFWYLISGTAFLMAASLILYRMKRKEVLGK